MIKTPNLDLPIYDKPSTDTFKVADWNKANENIDYVFGELKNNPNVNAIDIKAREDIINNHRSVTEQMDNIASDACSFGANPNNSDNTKYIQQALDKKGTVTISKEGVYYTKKLLIDSNTKFVLKDGVTLKLIEGTSDFLLVNKNYLNGTNENIEISGGKFDFSAHSSQVVGKYPSFCGMGVLFNSVKNLTIRDIGQVGNARKYAFLLCNVTNGVFENLNIINGSDGLHFQAPCNNVKVNNITGLCHDNMIALTIGDYPNYVVSETGIFNNFKITNIFSDTINGSIDLIRFTGCGSDSKGYFENITVENVKGSTGNEPIIKILRSDQYTPNPYLTNTIVKNISFKNITPIITNENTPVFEIGGDINNIDIENVNIEPSITTGTLANITGGTIKNIKFKNIDYSLLMEKPYNGLINYTNATLISLILDNVDVDIKSTNVISMLQSRNPSNVIINNCKINLKNGLIYSSDREMLNEKTNIRINNSNLNLRFLLNIINDTNLYLTNTNITKNNINDVYFVDLLYKGKINIFTQNSYLNSDLNIANITESASVRINSTTIKNSLLISQLKGCVDGDIVRANNNSEPFGIGLYSYIVNKWVKLDNIPIVYNSDDQSILSSNIKSLGFTCNGLTTFVKDNYVTITGFINNTTDTTIPDMTPVLNLTGIYTPKNNFHYTILGQDSTSKFLTYMYLSTDGNLYIRPIDARKYNRVYISISYYNNKFS